jgi:uracil-DNA glycosylase
MTTASMSAQQKQQFEDLQKQMRACRACLDAGHSIEPPAVTQGLISAQIMSIGQAPGITEVEAKRPFNAGSGKRLFEWLTKAGIEEDWFRATQYMTSVTKCYPGRVKGGSGDRVPSRAEQALCRPYLDQEVELVAPKLVIPIGRLAIELFYAKGKKLNEIIGSEIEAEGRWIVPLPHPSGASRWHQAEENRVLIDQAIGLIGKRVARLTLN